MLFASGCIYALVVGTDTGAGVYYSDYFWEWKPNEVSSFALWQAISVITLVLLASWIASGRSKKKIDCRNFSFLYFCRPFTNDLKTIGSLF